MESKYELLEDRILVKPIEQKKSSIIVENNSKEKPMFGEVVAVGPGKDGKPMKVNVGFEVLFPKFSGHEVELEEGSFLVISETEILMITKKN